MRLWRRCLAITTMILWYSKWINARKSNETDSPSFIEKEEKIARRVEEELNAVSWRQWWIITVGECEWSVGWCRWQWIDVGENKDWVSLSFGEKAENLLVEWRRNLMRPWRRYETTTMMNRYRWVWIDAWKSMDIDISSPMRSAQKRVNSIPGKLVSDIGHQPMHLPTFTYSIYVRINTERLTMNDEWSTTMTMAAVRSKPWQPRPEFWSCNGSAAAYRFHRCIVRPVTLFLN